MRGTSLECIEILKNEWNRPVDATLEGAAWRAGLDLYDASDIDDYPAMMRATELMCEGLRGWPFGIVDAIDSSEPYFDPSDRLGDWSETCHCVLMAATARPPDGVTLADSAHRAIRLALLIARVQGWQPIRMNGDGTLSGAIDDHGRQMLFMVALGGVTPTDFFSSRW